MDSSISVSSTIRRQSLKPNISRLNVSGAGLNRFLSRFSYFKDLSRSRSACRVGESLVPPATSRTNCKSKSPARRSKTPTRGSVGGMSRCLPSGRSIQVLCFHLKYPLPPNRKNSGVGDRFIPNRSTTDFEHSMHSMLATRCAIAFSLRKVEILTAAEMDWTKA